MMFLDVTVVTKNDRLIDEMKYLFAAVITCSNSLGYLAYLCIMRPEFETDMFCLTAVNTRFICEEFV